MEKRRIVFISHANPEDNEFASWLGARLAAAGYEVWTDVLNLKGGEAFWRDIGAVIREQAAIVIVALSRASYQKEGVLNEIALSVNTGRKLKKDQFIIPVRLDNLPFSDFPEQLIRLNAINFSSNWADGFSELLKIFEDTQVPQSISNFGEALAIWQKYMLRQSTSICNAPELVFSNWFQISSLPSHINFSRFNASQKSIKLAPDRFQSPTTLHKDMVVGFAETTTLQIDTPDISLESVGHIPLERLLSGQIPNGVQISWWDARNMVTGLLRQSWEQFVKSQGLVFCEFAHGSAWFVPLDLIEGNIVTFQDENGRKRRRRLVGRSEKRKVYWHFAVSEKVNLADPRHVALRPHVVFTEDGKTPLDSKARAFSLRRSFCKNWWNPRWRDLLRAFVTFMSNGNGELILPLGGDAEAIIDASPMSFDAPLSIVGDVPVPATEEDHIEGETEADALDDFDGDSDEDDFGYVFEDEDVHGGEAS